MSVVVVDWLGRGGIAHCSEAMALVLVDAGRAVTVVSRTGRELEGGGYSFVGESPGGGRIRAHLRVAGAAVQEIERQRPSVVVVANYVIPVLEARVFAAARRVGAEVVFVVHDGRLHAMTSGSHVGLRHALRDADRVVVHSQFVASQVAQLDPSIAVEVVPLPSQVGLLRHPAESIEFPEGPVATHFGALRRRYKGTDIVRALAASDPPGWSVVMAGVGATPARGVTAIDRFLRPGELRSVLERSSVTILPYSYATQSGAVALAQVLGAIPIATAVGGIPEQIEHGKTGWLLQADDPVAAWRDALRNLLDEGVRESMASACRASASERHDRFRRWATSL